MFKSRIHGTVHTRRRILSPFDRLSLHDKKLHVLDSLAHMNIVAIFRSSESEGLFTCPISLETSFENGTSSSLFLFLGLNWKHWRIAWIACARSWLNVGESNRTNVPISRPYDPNCVQCGKACKFIFQPLLEKR